MPRLLSLTGLSVASILAAGTLGACTSDGPSAARSTTPVTTTATPPPSTTPGQAPAQSAKGGTDRVRAVEKAYGRCLTQLDATPLVDVGDGRSVTSTIRNGAVTVRWTVSGDRVSPADEGTADFMGAAGC